MCVCVRENEAHAWTHVYIQRRGERGVHTRNLQMHARANRNTCIRTYIHTYIHAHARLHTHIYTYIHTRTYIHTYIHIRTHACIQTYIHTYTRGMCTHDHIRTCIYTYICTQEGIDEVNMNLKYIVNAGTYMYRYTRIRGGM